jgi:hypothetical protein
VQFETELRRELVHVVLHHPAFAMATEEQRNRAALLTLDNLLGEDGVEKWIGSIETSVPPLPGGKPLEELAAAIDALAGAATGERFAILEGRTAGGRPAVSTVNLALKRVDHLLMDLHLAVTVPLREPTSRGLTTNEEAASLNALEDELFEALGADAVYIGRETGDGARVMHFHVATVGPAEERVRERMGRHPNRGIRLRVEADPAWKILRRW